MPLGLFITTKANLLAGKYTFSYCYPTGELKQKRKTYRGTKKEEEKQEEIWSSTLCLLTCMLRAHLALFICVHFFLH